MKQLIETIEELRLRGIGFRGLTEALDTTTARGRSQFGRDLSPSRPAPLVCDARSGGYSPTKQ
jgi:hypothetical protein